MKRLLCMALLIGSVFFIGCENDDALDQPIHCSRLAQSLAADDTVVVEAEINRMLSRLNRFPESDLEKNFHTLVLQLDACPTLQVIDSCYECVYTLPAISEIRVSISAQGQTSVKTIDLLPKGGRLVFLTLHD